MGALLGKSMQEQMRENGKIQLERQMQMQDHMRQQQMAMSLARARDLFQYWAAFYCVATLGSVKAYSAKRNPVALVPLVPLTFIVAYFGDMAYGSKMTRIRFEAMRILESEKGLLDMPHQLPSPDVLDQRRTAYTYSEK